MQHRLCLTYSRTRAMYRRLQAPSPCREAEVSSLRWHSCVVFVGFVSFLCVHTAASCLVFVVSTHLYGSYANRRWRHAMRRMSLCRLCATLRQCCLLLASAVGGDGFGSWQIRKSGVLHDRL